MIKRFEHSFVMLYIGDSLLLLMITR